MPELPEVETTRRGIEPHVVGKTVSQLIIRESRLRWPVSPELGQVMTGNRIDRVTRRAKYLLFDTATGRMMVHLGMSGSLRIAASTSAPRKHDHIDISFSDATVLRYHDPRRFGSVFWIPAGQSHELIDHLGPEPLTDEFDGDYLYRLARRRKLAVKLFIMNSQVVVGVGNIYANEALHRAGIRPDRPASGIARRRFQRLAAEIKSVLASAIDSGGTTLRDFVREDGSPGYFKQSLLVYGRGTEPCMGCGHTLRETRLGNRTTVCCYKCQT